MTSASKSSIDYRLENQLNSDAEFSDCNQYRYALWRIWDTAKPKIMFVGLNPSKADKAENDPTVRKIMAFAKQWNFGEVYRVNCFPKTATNPAELIDFSELALHDEWLAAIAAKCDEMIFAWGNFSKVKELGRDVMLAEMLPEAKVLGRNKTGSPRHPLYVSLLVERKPWGAKE